MAAKVRRYFKGNRDKKGELESNKLKCSGIYVPLIFSFVKKEKPAFMLTSL